MKNLPVLAANRCGFCGAHSYRRVVARDAQGVMRYADRLVCSGCKREFENLQAWRQGAADELAFADTVR